MSTSTELTARPAVTRRQAMLRCLAIVSMVAAAIHFAVAGEHFAEYWAFGVFMVVVALAQAAWAMAALVVPSRLLLIGGALLNAAVIGVYVVTRTVGDLVGPTPHATEPIGFGDALCTTLEAMLSVGCVLLLVASFDGIARRSQTLTLATGVIMAGLLTIALFDGGPEMAMGGNDTASAIAPSQHTSSGMHMSDKPAALSLATSTPAGSITMPDPHMQMEPGMRMATSMCTATPTQVQQHKAVHLVDRSWHAAQPYRSLAAAKAAGYRPITPTGLPVVHYLNVGFYRDSILGGTVLDTGKPQSLVYANTPKGAVLVASMYIMSPFGSSTPPQPGGCLTQWHVHTNLCLSRTSGVVGLTGSGNSCPTGSFNRATPPMLHVWYVPIDGGPTAVDAPDSQIVHAAEKVSAPHNARA